LLLADRHMLRRALGKRAVQPGEGEDFVDVARASAQHRAVADVLGDGAREQCGELRDDLDFPAELEHVVFADVPPAVGDRAGVRIGETVQQPQQRRLARA